MIRIAAINCENTKDARVYQAGLELQAIVPELLNANDPRSQNWKLLPPNIRQLYETLQRSTKKTRREAIGDYVVRRMSPKATWIGAFPPICIGMPLPPIFKSSPGLEGDFPEMGTISIQSNHKHPNVLLDGLGRLTGLLDLMDDEAQPPEIKNWLPKMRVPVMILTGTSDTNPLTIEQLGQLFHDFNTLSVPVSKGQAIDLDRSDDYIQTTGRIGELKIITDNGGIDERAISIGKSSSVWTTKSILLKAVRAAAEGPGAHVDHVRDQLSEPWLKGDQRLSEMVDRFDHVLSSFVSSLPNGKIPTNNTLLRTPTWWVAFGLIVNDLYKSIEGASLSGSQRDTLVQRLAKIDWSLGNPEFGFLGTSAPDKSGAVATDESGRPVINRFHGGSKAYYNLAAFIRKEIRLRDHLTAYGDDYGASLEATKLSAAAE